MKTVPIKEDRIDIILSILECMNQYKFDRNNMRKCILDLYNNKSEKSVFRGIAIPTLRKLGLIIGHNDYIRPSANGSLLLFSKKKGIIFERVLRTVFLEIDNELFCFIDYFLLKKILEISFSNLLAENELNREYSKRWIKILKNCDLIKLDENAKWPEKRLALNRTSLLQAKNDLNYDKKKEYFFEYLFKSYKKLVSQGSTIVDIEDIRRELGINILKDKMKVVTEKQFDNLLRDFPLVTDDYIISLGKPMGSEEKLFNYNNSYYRTISIKIF